MRTIIRALFAVLIMASYAGAAELTLSTGVVPQGEVIVFRVEGLDAEAERDFTAWFSAGEAFVTPTLDGAWGIAAADLEAEPGGHVLRVASEGFMASAAVKVRDGGYGLERLTLPEDKVTLSERDLKRVKRESKELEPVWDETSGEPLWDGPFVMPAEGRTSGEFGTRRILNGEPRSPHSGLDIAAPAGTPVVAANTGRVAFVGDFFFNGRFVVVDHGLGVFTVYTHLRTVEVREGDMVEKGAAIGEMGSTGRATGPHLHFSVKVGTARVSPRELFNALKESGSPTGG